MPFPEIDTDILIAVTLKRLRNRKGLDQQAMMKATGLTRSTWYKIESGKRPITVSELQKVLGVLGISQAQFYQEMEKTKKNLVLKLNQQAKKDGSDVGKFLAFILATLAGGALISFLVSLLTKNGEDD